MFVFYSWLFVFLFSYSLKFVHWFFVWSLSNKRTWNVKRKKKETWINWKNKQTKTWMNEQEIPPCLLCIFWAASLMTFEAAFAYLFMCVCVCVCVCVLFMFLNFHSCLFFFFTFASNSWSLFWAAASFGFAKAA